MPAVQYDDDDVSSAHAMPVSCHVMSARNNGIIDVLSFAGAHQRGRLPSMDPQCLQYIASGDCPRLLITVVLLQTVLDIMLSMTTLLPLLTALALSLAPGRSYARPASTHKRWPASESQADCWSFNTDIYAETDSNIDLASVIG